MRRYYWVSTVSLLVLLLGLAGCGLLPGGKTAKFPSKQVTTVITANPGSPLDIWQRTLAQLLEKEWGVSVVPDNKSAGQGAVGVQAVLSQPPDGHNNVSVTASQGVAVAANSMGAIDSADKMRLLGRLEQDTFVLAVQASSPWKSWVELQGHLKANPGKLSMGGYGATSIYSLNAAQFAKKAAVEWKWVAYESTPQGIQGLLSGEIQLLWVAGSSVPQYVKSGDFRILGAATAGRLKLLPDIPTFKEMGVDHQGSQWRGLVVHPQTPQDVLDIYYAALKKSVKDPSMVERAQKEGTVIMDDIGPQVQESFKREVEEAKQLLAALK